MVDTLRCSPCGSRPAGQSAPRGALGEAQTSEEAETGTGTTDAPHRTIPTSEAAPAKAVPRAVHPAEAVSQEAVSQEAVSEEASADSTEQLTTSARAAAPEKTLKSHPSQNRRSDRRSA